LLGSIRNRLNCPRPADVPIFVEGPSSAAAFPDLHSPVVTVSWDCENKCDRGRHDHSTEDSNQKYASHFSHKLNRWASSGYCACDRFCRATEELNLPPSFALVVFPHFPASASVMEAPSICQRDPSLLVSHHRNPHVIFAFKSDAYLRFRHIS